MKRIIYIMGVSGSGKTTIGKLLSAETGLPFFDGDNYHPAANKEKMRAGIPLNDDDRQGWLLKLNELARDQAKEQGAIIACSALKEKYRAILANGLPRVFWVFLEGNFELIHNRMQTRHHEYMPAGLLQSQFDTLEVPASALKIDINNDPGEIVRTIRAHLAHKG